MINDKKGQTEVTAMTVDHLVNYGVRIGDQRQLEFFFYANDKAMAMRLAYALRNTYGYEIYKLHKSDKKWAVIGMTTPLPILTEMVQAWVEEMCDLGDRYNCQFDGWGTLA